MRHLILGAGPAGVIAAEQLRALDPSAEITIVGGEDEAPYSRMAIPYLLIGKVGEDGTYLRHDPAHFERLRIGLRRGRRAVKVDGSARTVTLDDGSVLGWDRLLIATGARPVRPPIPGLDSPGVETCWTLDDARAIAAAAHPGARVVQMGAGFIGCIIMEALAARGARLVVVEMGDRMVPRMMGETAGTMIADWCEQQGVTVRTKAKVLAIEAGTAPPPRAAQRPDDPQRPGFFVRLVEKAGLADPAVMAELAEQRRARAASADELAAAPLRVRLSTGEVLAADLVINATGVRPQIGFLDGSGIACGVGIRTDAAMRTNVDGIFAAGDCAEALDLPSGGHVVSAIQPTAAEQARIAALNMVGQPTTLKRVPQINVLDTLGLISCSFGQWQGVPGGRELKQTDGERFRHLSLQLDPSGERVVGANAIGLTQHVGVLRGLVEGDVRLSARARELLEEDPGRVMEAYLDSAQASAAWTSPGRPH